MAVATIFAIDIDVESYSYDFMFPENLDRLPDWIVPILGGWEHIDGCVVRLDINRPPTWANVDELERLSSLVEYSLYNSDRGFSGRQGYPMCHTLHTTFKLVRGTMLDALATASYKLSDGSIILSRYCLETSPHGKRYLHDLSQGDTPDVSGLRVQTEKYVQEHLQELLANPVHRSSYLTGM